MRKPVSLPLYVLVVVTLLLSLVPPTTMAQSRCPEPLVGVPELNPDYCVDPETGLYVPPEDYPTEVPPPPPEPPALPEGNLASFTLYHLACDDDFDPNGVRDAGGLGSANGCLTYGKPPFTYTLSANGIPITSATLDATERDFARFDVPGPIPAGTLTIAVVPVAPYTTEFISCGLEVGEAGTDVIEPAIAGGSATLATLPDQKVECWVYNVNRQPMAQDQNQGEDEVVGDGNVIVDPEIDESNTVDTSGATGATITIAAYLCPAGVTATDDLIAACTQRASGLAFSLLTANETLETQTSDAEGDIFYSGVPANDYGIAAALPTGYGEPIVICYVADPLGNVSEEQRDVVFGNQIRLRLGDGFNAECAWYNVPDQGLDSGPNVFIQARKCGPGTQITASMTVTEAEELCVVVYPNQTFQILYDEAPVATKATNDDPLSLGQAYFTRLPAPNGGGIYGITATMLEGEQTLGVFCDQNYGDDRYVTVTTSVVDGYRIDQELLEGWTLRCSWFIEINPALGGTQVADPPVQDLAPTSEESEPESPAPGITAGEDATDPGETPVEAEESEASPAAGTGGSETSWAPGIMVLALLCPADVAGQDLEVDLTGDCSQPASGLSFEILVDDESTGTYVTDANGEFVIPVELGPGAYLFRHEPASDQLEVRTVCSSVYENGATATGQSRAVGPEMSELYLTYDGASSITCTFYIVMDSDTPETDGSTGAPEGPPDDQASSGADAAEGGGASDMPALTLTFLICPDGTDPTAEPAVLEQTCVVETLERSLILTRDNVTTAETVVGTGTWTFNDPVVDADIGVAHTSRVSCTSDWAEGAEQIPAMSLLNGGQLTVTLEHPRTAVSCTWFVFAQ